MIYKVTVQSGGNNNNNCNSNDSNDVKANTCFVSVISSSTESEEVMTVGRKNATIILDADKCVSRTHCSLHRIENQWKVQDLGSKFGTFVQTTQKQSSCDSETTNGEDDDTTDNEDIAPSQSMMQQSKLVRLAYNGSMMIDSSEPSFVIQCGPTGSSSIKLEKVPLEFCTSRLSSADVKQLKKLAANIGAQVSNVFEPNTITHLITPDKTSTAKILAAWAKRIPIVTLNYVEALLELFTNTSPIVQELPNESDFVPSGTLPMDTLIDPTLPRDCLKHYTFLLLQKQKESSSLIESAGGVILPTYEWTDEYFYQYLSEDSKICCFLDTKKGKAQRRQFLLNKQNIWCISQTNIATAISTLGILKDIHGTDIPCNNNPTQEQNFSTNQNHSSSENDGSIRQQSSSSNSQTRQPLTKYNDIAEEEQEITNHNDTAIDDDSMSNIDNVDNNNHIQKAEVETHKFQKQNEINEVHGNNTNKRILEEKHDSKSNIETFGKSKSKTNTTSLQPKNDKRENQSVTEDNTGDNKRKKLEVSSDGWFQAAPQAKQERAKYKRQKLQQEDVEEGVGEPAPTIYCKNMARLKDVDYRAKIIRRTNEDGIVDFKKFTKNSVIRGNHFLEITMKSVLPKETERQRQLELSQVQLEKDFQEAEALFSENNNARKRGGGIRNYFSPGSSRINGGISRGRRRR